MLEMEFLHDCTILNTSIQNIWRLCYSSCEALFHESHSISRKAVLFFANVLILLMKSLRTSKNSKDYLQFWDISSILSAAIVLTSERSCNAKHKNIIAAMISIASQNDLATDNQNSFLYYIFSPQHNLGYIGETIDIVTRSATHLRNSSKFSTNRLYTRIRTVGIELFCESFHSISKLPSKTNWTSFNSVIPSYFEWSIQIKRDCYPS